MPQEELDVFDLPAAYMAKFRARSAEIMRSEMFHLYSFATSPNYAPYRRFLSPKAFRDG